MILCWFSADILVLIAFKFAPFSFTEMVTMNSAVSVLLFVAITCSNGQALIVSIETACNSTLPILYQCESSTADLALASPHAKINPHLESNPEPPNSQSYLPTTTPANHLVKFKYIIRVCIIHEQLLL